MSEKSLPSSQSIRLTTSHGILIQHTGEKYKICGFKADGPIVQLTNPRAPGKHDPFTMLFHHINTGLSYNRWAITDTQFNPITPNVIKIHDPNDG